MFRRPFQWTSSTWLGFGVLSILCFSWTECFPNFFGNWGRPTIICNSNTTFSCPCETCWTSSSPFQPFEEEPQWIAVEFQKCPKLTQASEIEGRKKISEWLIEECAFVLDCSKYGLTLFTLKNIFIGGFECSNANSHGILYLSAVKNSSGKFESDNIIPASVLGSVVQAREHLFSNLFQADLDSVTTIEKRSQKSTSKTQKFYISQTPIMLAAIAFASLLLSFILTFFGICFCVICCFSRIQWSRFASSKWIKGTTKRKPKLQKKIIHGQNGEQELYSLKKSPEIQQTFKQNDDDKNLLEKEVLTV
jgi:hypothetical protein